nr:restriction endonuclease subunit S [Methylicorpusculum oleiharenae]
MNNVKPDGSWDWSKERRVPATTRQLAKYSLQSGDILFNATNSPEQVGKSALFQKSDEPVTFSNHFLRLKVKKSKVDERYLIRYLASLWKKRVFENMVDAWVNQATVQRDSFLALKIPVPPLAEQKRIAAILDKADSLRRKNQQAIQLADQFLRAVFLDLFGDPMTNPKGWDEIELKKIADIRSGVTKGKKVDLATAVTLPYMRVANVQDGYLDLSDIQNITVSRNDAEKFQLEKGDILLTEGGDPDKLGRGYVWNNEIPNCIHQNHIFSVRINNLNKIRPEFLSAVIASQRGKRYFLRVGKQTTGIATILSEFKPFVPPIELQDKFMVSVNKARTIKNLFASSEFNLFNSLSQKAFAGKL